MLDIPPAAAFLMDAVGLKYQLLFVDADDIRAFAQAVREFAQRVGATNDEGTQVVNNLGEVWEGVTYDALVAAWAHKNNANMAELLGASEVVADALDAAATTVEAVQAAVLAELAAMGSAFIGAQIVAAGTMGGSLATTLALRTAAHRLVSAMQEVLVGYLMEHVLEAAIKPLEDVVDRIINGYGRSALADFLGVSNRFRMDPSALENAANTFDNLAQQMTNHGAWLANQLADLFQDGGVGDFGDDPYRGIIDPSDMYPRLPGGGEIAAPPGVPAPLDIRLPDLTTDSAVVPAGPDVAAVGNGDRGLGDLNGADPYAPSPPPTPAAEPVAPNPDGATGTGTGNGGFGARGGSDPYAPPWQPPPVAEPVAPNANGAPVGADAPSTAAPSGVDHELGSDSRDIQERPGTLASTTSTPPPSMDTPWRTESGAPQTPGPGVGASGAPRMSDTWLSAGAAPVPWAGLGQDAAPRADENRPATGGAAGPPERPGKPRSARRARSEDEKHVLADQHDSAAADSDQVIPTPWEVAAKADRVTPGSDADRAPAPPVRAVVAPASRADGTKRTDTSRRSVAPKRTDAPKRSVAPRRSVAPKRTDAPKRSDAPKRTDAPKRSDAPKRTDASKVEVLAPDVTPPPPRARR